MNLANLSLCNIHIARMFPFPWANELLEIIQVGQPFTLCVGLCYPELVPLSEAASCNILYKPFKVQWVLYVPPGLTFRNSTFCPHCVYMCSAWITEQTAIISLYSINWLIFITETECIYCAVRIESLNTTEARVRFQVNSWEICGWQRYTGTGFSPSTSVSPVSIIPPMLHTHSFIYHWRYIMFFSQYFSFPCQYHSTNAPYSFIHLPPTLYNVFLPVLQFSLSVSFHQCSMLVFIVPGHTGYAWEHSKKHYAASEIGEDCTQKVVSLGL